MTGFLDKIDKIRTGIDALDKSRKRRVETNAFATPEDAQTDEDEKTLVGLLADVTDMIEDLAANQIALTKAAVQQLELKEGQGIIVKLGDPTAGWIPGPDHEKRILELFDMLINEELGLKNVPVLVYHYGMEPIILDASEVVDAQAKKAAFDKAVDHEISRRKEAGDVE